MRACIRVRAHLLYRHAYIHHFIFTPVWIDSLPTARTPEDTSVTLYVPRPCTCTYTRVHRVYMARAYFYTHHTQCTTHIYCVSICMLYVVRCTLHGVHCRYTPALVINSIHELVRIALVQRSHQQTQHNHPPGDERSQKQEIGAACGPLAVALKHKVGLVAFIFAACGFTHGAVGPLSCITVHTKSQSIDRPCSNIDKRSTLNHVGNEAVIHTITRVRAVCVPHFQSPTTLNERKHCTWRLALVLVHLMYMHVHAYKIN